MRPIQLDEWTKMYMRMAKNLADRNKSCHSRKVGAVLVSSANTVIGLGWNGTVVGGAAVNSPRYLSHLWTNLYTDADRELIRTKTNGDCHDYPSFVAKYRDQPLCPRRLVDAPSGLRLELCNCAHAERRALAQAGAAGASTQNSAIFCWCGVPCHECAIQIVESHVMRVVALNTGKPDYSPSSRGIFEMSCVRLDLINPEDIDGD